MRALWGWLFPAKEAMELSGDRLEILSKTSCNREIQYYAKPPNKPQHKSDEDSDCAFIDDWHLGSSSLFEPDPNR
jgi:hypothetical protein